MLANEFILANETPKIPMIRQRGLVAEQKREVTRLAQNYYVSLFRNRMPAIQG